MPDNDNKSMLSERNSAASETYLFGEVPLSDSDNNSINSADAVNKQNNLNNGKNLENKGANGNTYNQNHNRTVKNGKNDLEVAVIDIDQVALKKFCPHGELKTAFNQLMENRPQLFLMNGSDSAALIHQVWTEDTLAEIPECSFTIESNLYAGPQRYGRGIYASIKRMNFRQTPNGECIDYVRLTFGTSKTQRICGDFDADSQLGLQSHFNEDDGIIKVHVVVNKTVPLSLGGKRSLEIELVFTAYDACNAPSQYGKIRCHPKDEYFCIDRSFQNDGILNCPPPYCTDEPDKQCGRQTNQPIHPVNTHARGKNGASKSAFNSLITFVLFMTSAIIILI